MRKTTCSKDPGGMVRTIIPSKPDSESTPAPTTARMRRKSTATASWFSCTAARWRSRTCQPFPVERRAKRMETLRTGKERSLQDGWLNASEGVTLATLQIMENDLGGTEEHGVDLVEIVSVPFKN